MSRSIQRLVGVGRLPCATTGSTGADGRNASFCHSNTTARPPNPISSSEPSELASSAVYCSLQVTKRRTRFAKRGGQSALLVGPVFILAPLGESSGSESSRSKIRQRAEKKQDPELRRRMEDMAKCQVPQPRQQHDRVGSLDLLRSVHRLFTLFLFLCVTIA